ncbi:uncharacterized protein M421DRAFT_418410 [Didymella exigua CBS 183.55]|uniref:Uncharacterized protein n=1 Tax=Didymella exigua CBS 183.55 TaxID=1150837 RepID=A0A6A5S089_9PLEO|nr:uncharacterized protein M421DRAFT_418410 [Didymella exigua CBS 183.55]KAF1930927.1 hypothetical protein M421DRAFT_418410 [Didymella exigua CBS 183.55]
MLTPLSSAASLVTAQRMLLAITAQSQANETELVVLSVVRSDGSSHHLQTAASTWRGAAALGTAKGNANVRLKCTG